MKAEGANLVLLLQGVVGRNKPWSKESTNPNERGQVQELQALNARTGYGCEPEPDALSQNTVLFAHHAATHERPFGDNNGMESQYTYCRTREFVSYPIGDSMISGQMMSGSFKAEVVTPPGVSIPAGFWLCCDNSFDREHLAVGVLRKF